MVNTPKIRHFCLCGANLRSALITGILCTVHSLVYLVLWIIECVYQQPFKPFHALAITFYVISMTAYILMILGASLNVLRNRKILMIVSMVLNISDAILGLVAFYFNVKTTMAIENALDLGNNVITWILSIGVCVWAAILGYGAILEIQDAEDKTSTDNADPKDPKNPFDEE